MNTESLLVYKCIIINHLHWLEKYEPFEKCDLFEPIKLACYLDTNVLTKTELTYNNSLCL